MAGGGCEGVGRNPVRALGEDRTAVDDELEALAELVLVPVEHDGAQADLTLPAIDHARPVDELERYVVERLGAVAVRPPEFWVRDLGLQAGELRHLFAGEGNRAAIFRTARDGQCGLELKCHFALGVRLNDAHRLDAIAVPRLEADGKIDARGGEARAPVPA